MIHCYDKLWPKHPFRFRVPYQSLAPTQNSDKVEYRKTPSDIKGTVLSLLDDLDDDEMIYWCIDDKYPIYLNVPHIEKLHSRLYNPADSQQTMSGLLFCRCRGMLRSENLSGLSITDGESVLLERVGYEQIWIHQYLKVKVIRYLFESFPDQIRAAKEMDDYKKKLVKPSSHELFVTKENMAVFGESTSRGVLTKNCYFSMKEAEINLPDWCSEISDQEIIMGSMADQNKPLKRGYRWLKEKLRT